MTSNPFRRPLIGAAVLILAAGSAASAAGVKSISGAGATFPYPIYSKWADAYAKKTGVKLNYQAIGSGGGIKQIEAKTVDFGASDAPLKPKELKQNGLMQFPTVMGGVVLAVNLPGIKAGQFKLNPKVLADIYLGKVTNWNDPEIKKINLGAKLPDRHITVVHRSDGSGTTFIYTNYLSKVSPMWKKKVGNAKSVSWPTGIGGKGNQGVASYVQRIKGAIGYVEYAYALQNHMPYTKLKNRSGKYVMPTQKTFQAAASHADWKKAPGFYMILTDQRGGNAWPITGATFILVYKKAQNPRTTRAVLKFFDWGYSNGDKMAKSLDYIPMPSNVVKMVQQAWRQKIQGTNGKAVWTHSMSD